MTTSDDTAAAIDAHYGQTDDLEGRILAALAAMGKDIEALTFTDLAPVDHFHTGGIDASRALAQLAGVKKGAIVLDIGGGLGGPARMLAEEFGASVTVLDLTESFVTTGAALTARLGMERSVRFRHGDAVAMTFPNASFDLAWSQNATMNIADKERLYAEIARVLRRGALLAFQEIMAGPGGPPMFPVPWASDPSISSLLPPDEVRSLLAGLGFVEVAWNDVTAEALAGHQATLARAAVVPGPPPFGVSLILGADSSQRLSTMGRNLDEDRVRVIQAVFNRS